MDFSKFQAMRENYRDVENEAQWHEEEFLTGVNSAGKTLLAEDLFGDDVDDYWPILMLAKDIALLIGEKQADAISDLHAEMLRAQERYVLRKMLASGII